MDAGRPHLADLVGAAAGHRRGRRGDSPLVLAASQRAGAHGWPSAASGRQPACREALPIVLTTRTAVFVAGFLAIAFFGYRADVPVPWRIYENEFLNLPARWDTGWYLGVAIEGYAWAPARDTVQQNIAFFPVYPMLMRYGSLFLGRETMWTGVLISWLAFFAALVYLYRFTRDRWDDERAGVAIALLACYPFAFFFSTAYTESLFLLTMIGACYHFERGSCGRRVSGG